MNARIRARQVRVVDEAGGQLGVMETKVALDMARDRGMDLVEISPNAQPPVCKIIDYGKYKYQLKKKSHEAKKKQFVALLKEVKFRPRTEEHDFAFKVRHILRFLDEGHKAKVTVVFRGREMAHQEFGRLLLERVVKETEVKGKVERFPKMEGRSMIMILTPNNQK